MNEETEVGRTLTAWLPDDGRARLGHAILTTERLVFYDEKFSPNAAFGLANMITESLQRKHEEGGPMVVIDRADILEVTNEKKLLNKDRIRIRTTAGEFLFNDGWKAWSPHLLPR